MPVTLRKTSKAESAAVAPAVGDVRLTDKPSVSAPPRDLAELSPRLNCLVSGRHAVLADVADDAIEHPYEIAFGAAPRFASRCAVSLSSVVRLARILGFKGFRDMRGFYRRHLRHGRCREDDRPLTCSYSGPAEAMHMGPSSEDDAFPRSDGAS